MSDQGGAVAKRANRGVARKGIPSRGKKSLSHCLWPLLGHTWNTVLSFGSHYAHTKKKWMGLRGPEKGHKEGPGTGKLSYEERLRHLGWFSHEKRD